MKKCILCNKLTNGSVGAAGIKWDCICQECKDFEDRALHEQVRAQIAFFKCFDMVKPIDKRLN